MQVQAVLEEMQRIKAAQELAQAEKETTEADDEAPPPIGPGPLPKHRISVDKQGTPKGSAQRNFTDADSRIMKNNSGFLQGYNGHIAVCDEHQIIVAQGLSNQSPDAEYFVPMLDRLLTLCGRIPEAALADAGFFSGANIRRAEARGIDVYIAPARTPHGEKEPAAEQAPERTSPYKAAMQSKLKGEPGEALYRRCKAIVEPVFGQLKNHALGRLSLRGLDKARAEWSRDHAVAQPAQAAQNPGQSPAH